MGVEVVASEVVQNGFSGAEHEKENGILVEPIKFGSNGDDVVVKSEVDKAPDTTGPTNVADEWPAEKKTHSFYFIRYRPYDDPKIRGRVEAADREASKRIQRRNQLFDEIRAKKTERAGFIQKLKDLTSESRQYKEAADGKRKEMGPLQEALGQMRNNNSYGSRGATICSSEEELNKMIYSLNYHIQHESITLSEEKQILREIKQLEGTRDKVIANAAARTKIQESLGPKEDLQDKVKLISVDLNGVKKEQQAISAKIKALDEAKKAIDAEIKVLQDELTVVTEKRDEAYQTKDELRKKNNGENASYNQNYDLLQKVRDLCAKKDIQTLEELANIEVEKFMSSWCSSKAFRDDYEKRLLKSLDNRQLSRDGRMRNPDEKPLVVVEAPPKAPEPEAKPIVKRPKEDPKPVAQQDPVPAQKEANGKVTDSKPTSKHEDIEAEEIYGLENTTVKSEVEVPKTKEMIREEEMAKAKQALERKKKLAEKAAAKAAIRAQKEAEKKNKVIEKKLKKKAAASAPPPEAEPEEAVEAVTEPAEPENVEPSVEAPPTRAAKNNKVRHRPRGKGPEALPKVILKRKKSTNYWVWAAPAVVLVLVLIALGYHYLL